MTRDEVLELAPDAASAKAARDLAKPASWLALGAFDSEEGEVVWGEFKGSGNTPYQTRVGFDARTFNCSCPSRKVPCKHALALALIRADAPEALTSPVPDWAESQTNASAGELELPSSWQAVLGDELEKPYFQKLRDFLREERATQTIYPPAGDEFNALKATPYEAVKVLILGQDPYHGPKQAHGMAFSVQPGIKPPPSLQNMYLELKSDLGIPVSKSGYLQHWAEQGVLLLNAVLTVRQATPNSHKGKGWETFTDAVIRAVSDKPEPVIFVLWGAYAQKKEKLIDTDRHTIIKSVHPSPLSAHNGFFGSKPFSQINAALQTEGRGEIDWNVD